MTTSILDDTPPLVPAVDPEKDYLAEFVGEGLKYKDTKALARAVAEKEAHILRTERENAILREDLKNASTKKRMEEMLDQLSALQERPQTPIIAEPTAERNEKGLSVDDVRKMMAEDETRKRQESNKNAVLARLRSEFGSGYVSKIDEAATTLGVGKEFLDSVAISNPQAFYKLMGLGEKPQVVQSDENGFAPPRSRVTPGFAPQSDRKNWSYYENMRKTEALKYNSLSVQWEMDQEAQRQGPDFYK